MRAHGQLTVAAGAATLLAALALLPTHDDSGWLWLGAVATAFVGLLGYGLRTISTPRLLVPVIQLVAVVWVVLLFQVRDAMHYGFVPSLQALSELGFVIQNGLAVVVRYSAPLPYDANALFVTALGVALVAVFVDAIAVTARLAPWAGLPLLLLYSIPATTVTGGLSAAVFIPTAVGYVVLLMVESKERLNRWGRFVGMTERGNTAAPDASTSVFGRTGRRVGTAAICSAVIVPLFVPSLPPEMLSQGQGSGIGGGGGQTIRIDNPIVNLRRDLRLPENFDLFTYETDASSPEYLRLAVLDEFDGQQWRPTSREVPREQQVSQGIPAPPGLTDDVEREEVTTQVSMSDTLRSKRLPLPYPPTQVDVEGDWRYDTDTLDVVVGPDGSADATADLEYTATSLTLTLEQEQLDNAPEPPAEITEQYTEVPDDLPDHVTNLASEVAGDAETSYAQAVELQAWFRSEFVYSTLPEPGHGGSHLVEFLEDRRGYCEQFAATMAIMARSLGIPARVAVGYLPGTHLGDSDWVVKVHDAHAWPELYFEGYGWVRFEPTPSQQTGAAPSWTETTPDTAPAPESTFSPSSPDSPDQEQEPSDPGGGAVPMGPDDPGTSTAPVEESSLNPMPFLIAAAVLSLFAVPLMIRLLIRRSRLSARHTPTRLAEGAWRELADTMRDYGFSWDESYTPRAAGAQVMNRMPPARHGEVAEVVRAVERTRYAPTPGESTGVVAAIGTIRATLRSGLSRRRRILAALLPLSLFTRRRAPGSS